MILVDTCVLIEYFRGNPDVTAAIKENGDDNVMLNSIILMELLVGARNKVGLNSLKKRLNNYQVLQINQNIMDQAAYLVESFYLSHGLKIPDAIIAASSISYIVLVPGAFFPAGK